MAIAIKAATMSLMGSPCVVGGDRGITLCRVRPVCDALSIKPARGRESPLKFLRNLFQIGGRGRRGAPASRNRRLPRLEAVLPASATNRVGCLCSDVICG